MDPYRGYAAPVERAGSIQRPSFPGYLSAEPSPYPSHHLMNPNDLHGSSGEFATKDPRSYGVDPVTGIAMRAEPVGHGGLTPGPSMNAYPTPVQDPLLLSQRPDVAGGVGVGVGAGMHDRPGSLARVDGFLPPRESNILFVDGLPTDCSRREVGHLFRPFIGFKDIKVVHKEPRRSGDKPMVLCFVEFDDAKCARTALEALQGYKFDDKKAEAPVLRIHFAHFPFSLPPSEHGGDQRLGGLR